MCEVSVICLAFNHEKYIRECLNNLVNQVTSFEYEIIVHDDCSSDSTQIIIDEYAKKYPRLIKTIYQGKNLYSRIGLFSLFQKYITPKIEGRYVAFCEGDDSWSSEQKLQLQYDFMEAHPDCSLCVHNAILFDNVLGHKIVFPDVKEATVFEFAQIAKCGGNIFSTNSLFSKREVFLTIPECFAATDFLDYQWFLYAAMLGKVMCLPQVMSVYNSCSDGSFTAETWNDIQRRIIHLNGVMRMLSAVDEFYSFSQHDVIAEKITHIKYQICMINGDYRELCKHKYFNILKKNGWRSIIKVYCLGLFPCIQKVKRHFTKEGSHECHKSK